MTTQSVHFVVPCGIDDPRRPSGGNRYDGRLIPELTALGWRVEEHRLGGAWPRPDEVDQNAFAATLAAIPDHSIVLVDGLIGSAATAMTTEAGRLHLVVLLHMPLAEAMSDGPARLEGVVLRSVAAVIATSAWTRTWVIGHHGVRAERVSVAAPGVELGPIASRSEVGGNLLCVGPVIPAKGNDTLLEALGRVADLDWRCTWVGSLDLAPDFAASLVDTMDRAGLADRIALRGPLPPGELDALRAGTDLAVSASRRESFGMAVAEALARGIPVVATTVGGQVDVIGDAGILVPVGDVDAFEAALRRWLTDAGERAQLRRAAERRRSRLSSWQETAGSVADVLADQVNHAGRGSVLHLQDSETGGRRQEPT